LTPVSHSAQNSNRDGSKAQMKELKLKLVEENKGETFQDIGIADD
jgi:hypothetical protein